MAYFMAGRIRNYKCGHCGVYLRLTTKGIVIAKKTGIITQPSIERGFYRKCRVIEKRVAQVCFYMIGFVGLQEYFFCVRIGKCAIAKRTPYFIYFL